MKKEYDRVSEEVEFLDSGYLAEAPEHEPFWSDDEDDEGLRGKRLQEIELLGDRRLRCVNQHCTSFAKRSYDNISSWSGETNAGEINLLQRLNILLFLLNILLFLV